MDKVADGAGHKLYEQQRSLEAISQIRSLTREEKIRIVQLKNEQFELYENTWNKIISK